MAQIGHGQEGQASVELVAAIPIVALVAMVAAQLALAGFALWSAGVAARTGARSAYVGGDARASALHALPGPLRRGSRVEVGDEVSLRVPVPALVPGLTGLAVTGSASLGAGSDGG